MAIKYLKGEMRISEINLRLCGRVQGTGSTGFKILRAARRAYELGKVKIPAK